MGFEVLLVLLKERDLRSFKDVGKSNLKHRRPRQKQLQEFVTSLMTMEQ